VKDEAVVNPRFLHLFLSAACDDLLVPLMCGATNVTMASGQLEDVLVPVPDPAVQAEIVEAHLIRTTVASMVTEARLLSQSSKDPVVVARAERLVEDLGALLETAAGKATIDRFLPEGGASR
jgi:hypothetical protein